MSELRGKQVVLRPLDASHAEDLREIRLTPEVAAHWGPLEDDFPLGDEPEVTRFTILAEGRVAGMIQFLEELEPDARSAAIDVFIDPARHDRGHGTDALRTIARYLIEQRGHHRITIDPAVDNPQAIRSYEKAGFRRVGVTHASFRDPGTREWIDELLMELVVRPQA